MKNRKRMVSIAFTGALTAAGLGYPGAQAVRAASGTWKITSNGTDYAGPISAVNSIGVTLTMNGTKLTCARSAAVMLGTAQASIVTGTPAKLGTISTATFGTTAEPCTLGGIINYTYRLKKPVSLIASSYTSGVTHGKITDLACSATMTGKSLPALYLNSTHTLRVNPSSVSDLKITHVSVGHCDGWYTSVEPLALTTNFRLSQPLSITGP
ncbi:MAG: hypothetical protein ACRDN0_37345 [Trebonia sp.]